MIRKYHSQNIRGATLLLVSGVVVVGTVLVGGAGASAAGKPSAVAKKFFGFSNAQATKPWVQPAACNTAAAQQNKTLSQEITQVNSQLKTATDKLASLKQQAQSQSLTQSQQDQLNQEIQQQQSTVDSLQKQLYKLHNQQSQVNPTGRSGPSDSCKKAIVAETVSRMASAQTLFNKFPTVLAKVSSAVKKVEAAIPNLQNAGVSSSDISALQKDVKNAKADSAALNSFQKQATNGLSKWIATAEANPITTFQNLQTSSGRPNFMNQAAGQKAASAANNIVTAFTDMVNRLDTVNKNLGGNQ